jgi:hypothetical protein
VDREVCLVIDMVKCWFVENEECSKYNLVGYSMKLECVQCLVAENIKIAKRIESKLDALEKWAKPSLEDIENECGC